MNITGILLVLDIILSSIVIILGLIMLIFPRHATKEENREFKNEIAKTRRNGVIMIFIGVLIIAIGLV